MENEAESVSRRMMAQFVIENKVNHEDEISQVPKHLETVKCATFLRVAMSKVERSSKVVFRAEAP